MYEKAAYGSLAGFIKPTIPVCKTYYDYLWVYFKALYNELIDKELRYIFLIIFLIYKFMLQPIYQTLLFFILLKSKPIKFKLNK